MLTNRNLRFAPASRNESIVFGSARPGYRKRQVNKWVEFAQAHEVQHVCCLLSASQLEHYDDNLLDMYDKAFGADQTCWAPIEDFQLATPDLLIHKVLPFLTVAARKQERVVVHCSSGIGRTGHVLAAWLVAERELSARAAIAAVKDTGRNPYEAVIAAPFKGRSPWKVSSELHALLDKCRRSRNSPD